MRRIIPYLYVNGERSQWYGENYTNIVLSAG